MLTRKETGGRFPAPRSPDASKPLLNPDAMEPQDIQRMLYVVLHLVAIRSYPGRMHERNPRRVAMDQFLRLRVEFCPRGLVADLLGFDQQAVDAVALVERDVGCLPNHCIVL